jgi:hypothetical protein
LARQSELRRVKIKKLNLLAIFEILINVETQNLNGQLANPEQTVALSNFNNVSNPKNKPFYKSDVFIVLLIIVLVVFGPINILWFLKWVLQNVFLLDCHTSSGGTFNFPITPCGNVLFIFTLIYYIWFIIPFPLIIPAIGIFLLSKYFIQKSKHET